MGKCLKGKSEAEQKSDNFRCKKCQAISDKKKRLCEPKKIKGKDAPAKKQDKKKDPDRSHP